MQDFYNLRKNASDHENWEWLQDPKNLLYTELFIAELQARKGGKRKTNDTHGFEVNLYENLKRLEEALWAGEYEPSRGTAHVIFHPVQREIFAAPYRDRVIHHWIVNAIMDWWERRLCYDSYSCRVGRGTSFGIARMDHHIRSVSHDFERPYYVIKMDISGYFMHLPREKVFERVRWGLKQQFKDYMDNPIGYRLYKMCKYLWRQIIMDDAAAKAIRVGSVKDWDPEHLPPRKSLFCQLPGVGLVIGNLTSQLCSNIYLDQLDRFVTMELGYKWYGRYVDDFLMVVPADQYEQAKKDVAKIEAFLRDELELTLHPKKRYMQDVTKGVEFIGARIYPYCKYPSDRLQRKATIAVKRYAKGTAKMESLVSYAGMMVHYDAGNFLKKTFDDFEEGATLAQLCQQVRGLNKKVN